MITADTIITTNTISTPVKVLELNEVCLTYRTRLALFGHEEFNAINRVSFAINKGETIGIIGDNGCGKSTLLMLLAGIYQPDSGSITKNCKSISLLTLGIGFDKELSGKDNAIISAMLLGMSKEEALKSLDDIIAFSELGKAINKPVKTYSSGMKARLGFSVAVTLDVDLLLIDEVLGVGDAQFRKKAEQVMLNKINSVQTVVFVSHSEPQVRKLCQRVVWLDKGKVKLIGEPNTVYQHYNDASNKRAGVAKAVNN
jgi:lipopolysaccharide transport system ATP-binding protein